MDSVLIVDCETTGVDRERDSVIEIGYVLWSVKHRTMLEVYSGLLHAESNPAESINRIPVAALPGRVEVDSEWIMLETAARQANAIVAHQADFDRAFCERHVATDLPWICTREDMRWPLAGDGQSLIATALAHGVAVVAAHRAINDCLLIARLFEAVPDIAERLELARRHALLPRVRLVSLAAYEEREVVKQHGFKWDAAKKEWWRVMAQEDAHDFPFRTRVT